MCSHSAPLLIILLHSAVSWPKSDANTEGDIIARGILRYCWETSVRWSDGRSELAARRDRLSATLPFLFGTRIFLRLHVELIAVRLFNGSIFILS
jgi:hypothetical protein